MGIEFQCDECGQLLNVDTEPGMTVACPHCSADVIVPEALASLPQPQVEGASPPPPPEQQPDVDGEYLEEEEELEEEDSGVMTVMAHVMPWTISIFFHAGLALIFFLLVMIAQAEEVNKSAVVPSAIFNEDPGGAISHGKSNKIDKKTQPHRKVKASGESTRDLEVAAEGDEGETATLIGAAAGGGGGSLADYGLT
ncbi:MAG: hypothetical protein GY794_13055, partial [bacterium]|nr:hypothetical protein [bacterium]